MKVVARGALAWGVLVLGVSVAPVYSLEPGQVLILVNRDVSLSSDVARMYQRARGVPEGNVLRLHLGAERYIGRKTYIEQIAVPIKKYLYEHAGIQCILTTAGVPYVINPTPGTEDGAAVDNELAAVLRESPKNWNRWQSNPLYLRAQNPSAVKDPRALQMVYVARLDGPDLKTITRMVDDAVATETAGLTGPVFGDARGLDGNAGAAAADTSIRGAIDRLAGAGFPAVLDMKEADWRPADGHVGEQAAGAAFYVGWYSLQKFQDIFGQQGLARGAIAWHIASGEAVNIWDPKSTEWCINLIRRGAAVTLGPVFEPYVAAFPKAELLVESLLAGRSIVESYWLALPHTSWAMVLLGDPLYRPFGMQPRPALVARAYAGAAGRPVIEKGQTGPILIQVQCVGPPGAATAPFTASVEAESGLAAASGMVTIPALQAGQVTVVRVPSITALSDASGMFRLRLNVRNPGETARRIVLEGRTGFSKIVGLMDPQNQMFVSAEGEFVISGNAGNTILTEAATLQARRIAVPPGWLVAGAAFSPDATHIVLSLVHPEQKRVGFLLTDTRLQQAHSLPEESQFIRWLNNETVLLRKPTGMTQFNIAEGTALPVFEMPGWKVNTITPGTAVQLLMAADGRFAVRNGAGPVHEVLVDARVTRDLAAADDLSFFGGLDDQKRLWIQHGLSEKPEITAEQVERVAWGPVSRRVLVQADGKFRVYDSGRRSWIPLPLLVMAQWSPDEDRLLYVEAERSDMGIVPRYLSLLTGQTTEQLCDFGRIGGVGAMAFTRSGDAAFLLAGPDGGLQVWVTALPRVFLRPAKQD